MLRPGFLLPPLMFSVEEPEAIVVGSRFVSKRTDDRLTEAARNALAKIASSSLAPCHREQLSLWTHLSLRAISSFALKTTDLRTLLTID